VREAFRQRGHEAWSNDLVPADDGSEWHVIDDVREAMKWGHWDIAVLHPPCTYLCRAGERWLDGERMKELEAAAALFLDCWRAPADRVAVENPRMNRPARERVGCDPVQIIQPHMFGEPRYKATGLWLRRLPPLMVTDDVSEIARRLPKRISNEVHYMSPGPDRARRRSETYPGIARAMAAQWG
jgi:hypothetical protein